MLRIKIKKDRHYPCLIPLGLPIWVKKRTPTIKHAKFMFTDSCMFDLKDEDQWDVNKLFGFSIGHHHNCNSFRFGWRPILDNETIEIVAYEYHNGIRNKTMPICEINLYEWYSFKIIYNPILKTSGYRITSSTNISNFFVNDIYFLDKTYGLGYTLGIYFGGNETAPQDIIIYKKKNENI